MGEVVDKSPHKMLKTQWSDLHQSELECNLQAAHKGKRNTNYNQQTLPFLKGSKDSQQIGQSQPSMKGCVTGSEILNSACTVRVA